MRRINILQARPGMVLARDIVSGDGKLLLRKGTRLTKQYLQKLLFLGVTNLYVEMYEAGETSYAGGRTEVPFDVITEKTRLEAEETVRELLKDVKSGQKIKMPRVKRVVEKIVAELLAGEKLIYKLCTIRKADEYTFTHCLNVCVLALGLGIAKGYPPSVLKELGVAALLHDVGKVFVPPEILNKPGTLSEEEFAQIRKHPELGYRFLKEQEGVSELAAIVAYEHHEHYNGEGYPRGLRNGAIHEFARIVAIADVYDAITSDRVYKKALPPWEAVEIMLALSWFQFDPHLIKLFIDHICIYPVGTMVELSDGSKGVVVAANRSLPTRPVVRLLNEGGEMAREVDLLHHPTVFITRILGYCHLGQNAS